MLYETIKQRFTDAVDFVASNISLYAINPSKDFSRSSKFSIDKLLSFLVSRGSSSSKLELLDFFGFHSDSPSASALVQQQAKLKPDALEALFHQFHSSVSSEETSSPYCFQAVDGSTFTYFSKPSFSPPEYFVSGGHSSKGFYSMHLNALYDLQRHTYSDHRHPTGSSQR